MDPLIWLGLSLMLVAMSLTAVVVMALPVLRELSRAARSAEKLFDTLARELPATLESLRLTGQDLGDLSQQVEEGVRNASQVVKQVDEGMATLRHHAQTTAQTTQVATKSFLAGAKAAWRALNKPKLKKRRR